MSALFPEQPILFYPSLAARYGTDEALLLAVYHEFARHHGAEDDQQHLYFLARRREWQGMVAFWEEDRLAQVTGSLVSQGVLEAHFNSNGSVRIAFLELAKTEAPQQDLSSHYSSPAAVESSIVNEKVAEKVARSRGQEASASWHSVEAPVSQAAGPVSKNRDSKGVVPRLPVQSKAYQAVRGSHPPSSIPTASEDGLSVRSMLARGPAPSFGGSTGWNRPKDDLEQLFDQHEKRNQQLHEISLEWRPSETTYQQLKYSNIPAEFADGLIDEFIAYWMGQDKKRVSWDPPFISLAKREWVREQNRQGRKAREMSENNGESQSVGSGGERYQSNNRAEKRGRITEAVMDIKNLDWI